MLWSSDLHFFVVKFMSSSYEITIMSFCYAEFYFCLVKFNQIYCSFNLCLVEFEPQTQITSNGCPSVLNKLQTGEDSIQLKIKPGP